MSHRLQAAYGNKIKSLSNTETCTQARMQYTEKKVKTLDKTKSCLVKKQSNNKI